MAVAITISAVADDVERQELRLADFAMRCTLCSGAEITAGNELQGSVKLFGKLCRTAAVIGKRCDG